MKILKKKNNNNGYALCLLLLEGSVTDIQFYTYKIWALPKQKGQLLWRLLLTRYETSLTALCVLSIIYTAEREKWRGKKNEEEYFSLTG
jgi:hypothetical protein